MPMTEQPIPALCLGSGAAHMPMIPSRDGNEDKS
jgi:hypothetical protein